MLKRYPDDYKLYRSNTGFFIPRIIKAKKEESNMEIKNYIFRWFFFIGGFILLISILTFIFSNFPLVLIRYYNTISLNLFYICIILISYYGYRRYKWRSKY